MQFPSYKNKNVLILGLGLLGRGVKDAIFFAQQGANVVVSDLKTKKQLESSLKQLKSFKNITYVLGKHRNKDIDDADLIIRNAGVPSTSPFLKYALKKKKNVDMDESLFAKYCPCPIVGITGTRGKTTTATMIAEVLKSTGKKVYLAGNVMNSATLPLINKVTKDDIVVLELSSWQLQGFGWAKISPSVSVFTNIYPDHLNTYPSMKEYIADKALIFKNQSKSDHLFINGQQPELKKLSAKSPSKTKQFSSKDLPSNWKLTIPGEHNRENAAAAYLVAKLFKVPANKAKMIITSFTGVPHRLERIDTIRGVEYINDSTSTTPIAGQKAIAAMSKPITLIAGGASKLLDLSDFARDIAEHVQSVILLEGNATDDLKKLIIKFGGQEKIVDTYTRFPDAIKRAQKLATKGDVVLLSPGCASFGMFKNEYDRGDQFKKIVKTLS